MDECYLSSDSDEEIIVTRNKDLDSFEREFDELIEQKIRSDHKLESTDQSGQGSSGSKKDEDELYDPDKDDEDEEYMQSLNRSNQFDDNSKVKSDATLNCPCCLSLLSMETQKHVRYHNQYRAMFTFNCKIDQENPIVEQNKGSKRRKRNKHDSAIANLQLESNEIYYPVSCTICSTEVGVYDSDEVKITKNKMQENLEDLKLDDDFVTYQKEDEEINRQINNLISGIVERGSRFETDEEDDEQSNSESLESSDSSFEDETETFDDSLEYELNDENDWCDESDELLDSELSLEEEGQQSVEPKETANLESETGDSRTDEQTKKINELQEEVDKLKDMIFDFSKDLKSEITELIFEQFTQLEIELTGKQPVK